MPAEPTPARSRRPRCQLSVVPGPFTLEAAEAVAGAAGTIRVRVGAKVW